jgi:homoserine dehydrogenase
MTTVAMLGFGTVGSGVVEIIGNSNRRSGSGIRVSGILVRNAEKYRGHRHGSKVTESFEDVLKDDVDIVVEAMGGVHPAFDYVTRALESKKHVVTANKDLIAEHGARLLKIAKANGVELRFEASVGGGIPILKSVSDCLVGNSIGGVTAILNGTTNFILTKMEEEGMQYGEALSLAQELGFAEADPSSDVLGLDAARKLSILSTMAFHRKVDWKGIRTSGIDKVDSSDFRYAAQVGCSIKLLAVSRLLEDGVYASVSPVVVRKDSHLGRIRNEYNAVLVDGDAVGDVLFTGKGAGMMPTASAVFADIADIIKNRKAEAATFDYEDAVLRTKWESESGWLLRISSGSRIEAMKELTGSFSNCRIIAGVQGVQDDEVAAFVRAASEDEIDRFEECLPKALGVRDFRKMLVLGQ